MRNIDNPFKRGSQVEQEKSLYSNIWDDESNKEHNVSAKLDFYDTNNLHSETTSQAPESALDITKHTAARASEGLRERTDKLFKIAKSIKSPKFVDWKNSNIHCNYKDGTLFDFNNQDNKLYKETDIGTQS